MRKAIIRTGRGTVSGKLLDDLEVGFANVSVDLLGPVLAAIEQAGRERVLLTPKMVELAVDMIDAGAASLAPRHVGKSADVVLAELYDQEVVVRRDLELAEAEGDEVAAEIFRTELGKCQDRIARIIGEEATG